MKGSVYNAVYKSHHVARFGDGLNPTRRRHAKYSSRRIESMKITLLLVPSRFHPLSLSPFSSPSSISHNPDYEIRPRDFTSRESHQTLHGPGANLPVRLLRIQSKGSLHPCQQSYIGPSQQLGHQNRDQACSKLSSAIQSQVRRTKYLSFFLFLFSGVWLVSDKNSY